MRKSKTLRLHRQHDLDLITLYRVRGFSFSKEVRNILIAYVNRETYEAPEIDYENVDLGYLPTTIQYHLSLDPKKPEEKAVLDMLHDEIKYGYVNSFIKALVRAYIPYISLMGYGSSNGFVTRRITAGDIGTKMREAQRMERDSEKAKEMSPKELDEADISSKLSDVDQGNGSSDTDSFVSKDVTNETDPKEANTEETTDEIIQKKQNENQTEPAEDEPVRKEESYENDDEEDSFDDFLKMAQAFTGV